MGVLGAKVNNGNLSGFHIIDYIVNLLYNKAKTIESGIMNYELRPPSLIPNS